MSAGKAAIRLTQVSLAAATTVRAAQPPKGVLANWTRRKAFRPRTQALDRVTVELPAERIHGFTGRNGAGKTALLRAIAGEAVLVSGDIEIAGKMVAAFQAPMTRSPRATVEDAIRDVVARAGEPADLARALEERILTFADLNAWAAQRLGAMSEGMVARLRCSALIHLEADVYLIDGLLEMLDDEFLAALFLRLRGMAITGKTVVVSSRHRALLGEHCDWLGELEAGRLLQGAT